MVILICPPIPALLVASPPWVMVAKDGDGFTLPPSFPFSYDRQPGDGLGSILTPVFQASLSVMDTIVLLSFLFTAQMTMPGFAHLLLFVRID